eukprot:COSAG04_NODE_467_length_13861_cov_24.064889_2_plen_212_part_00
MGRREGLLQRAQRAQRARTAAVRSLETQAAITAEFLESQPGLRLATSPPSPPSSCAQPRHRRTALLRRGRQLAAARAATAPTPSLDEELATVERTIDAIVARASPISPSQDPAFRRGERDVLEAPPPERQARGWPWQDDPHAKVDGVHCPCGTTQETRGEHPPPDHTSPSDEQAHSYSPSEESGAASTAILTALEEELAAVEAREPRWEQS